MVWKFTVIIAYKSFLFQYEKVEKYGWNKPSPHQMFCVVK